MSSEEGRRIYIGNLQRNIAKEELEDLFNRFGKIESLWLAKHPSGFAFAVFETTQQAEDAAREMNGFDLKGQAMKVEISTSDGKRKQRRPDSHRRESTRYDSYMSGGRRPDHREDRKDDRHGDNDRYKRDYPVQRDREYDRREYPSRHQEYERRDYYDRAPADYDRYYDQRREYYDDRAYDYNSRRGGRSRSPERRYYDDRR